MPEHVAVREEGAQPTEVDNQVGRGVQLERSAVDMALVAATAWDSEVAERVPPRRRRFAVCWKWDHTNVGGHANGRSPCEPFLAIVRVPPHPIGVVAPVHQVGESDTDSVEFHAIHTPGSDGSESEDVVPLRHSFGRRASHSSHSSGSRQFGRCRFDDDVLHQGMHHEIIPTLCASGVQICDASGVGGN